MLHNSFLFVICWAIYKCQSVLLRGTSGSLRGLVHFPIITLPVCKSIFSAPSTLFNPSQKFCPQNPFYWLQRFSEISDIMSAAKHRWSMAMAIYVCPIRKAFTKKNKFSCWQWKEVRMAISFGKVETWDQNGFSQCKEWPSLHKEPILNYFIEN